MRTRRSITYAYTNTHAYINTYAYAETHTVAELRRWLKIFVARVEADLFNERAERERAAVADMEDKDEEKYLEAERKVAKAQASPAATARPAATKRRRPRRG